MIIIKKFIFISLLAAMFLISSVSIAATQTQTKLIGKIIINTGLVFIFAENNEPWATVTDCDLADYIILDQSAAGYSEIYALTVASYLQGMPFSSYAVKCYSWNGQTRPLVHKITSFGQ